jgi:hypothetical protein
MLKPSHFQTPRSLSDCSFTPSADPIERLRSNDKSDTIVFVACALAAIAAAVILAVWG